MRVLVRDAPLFLVALGRWHERSAEAARAVSAREIKGMVCWGQGRSGGA